MLFTVSIPPLQRKLMLLERLIDSLPANLMGTSFSTLDNSSIMLMKSKLKFLLLLVMEIKNNTRKCVRHSRHLLINTWLNHSLIIKAKDIRLAKAQWKWEQDKIIKRNLIINQPTIGLMRSTIELNKMRTLKQPLTN